MAAKTRKRKKGGITINKNTYVRRVGEKQKPAVTTGEILFLIAGAGIGVLAWQFLKPKTSSTSSGSGSGSTTPNTPQNDGTATAIKANYCTVANETVERRIAGGCGCDKCKGKPHFNFKTESF